VTIRRIPAETRREPPITAASTDTRHLKAPVWRFVYRQSDGRLTTRRGFTSRSAAIAFFYATGTAVGGITGPFLFGKMIETGEASQVAIVFFLGAAVMAVGGIVELFFGVKAPSRPRSRTSPSR
jgi:hypothetical protein